jgi:hypothetical protein
MIENVYYVNANGTLLCLGNSGANPQPLMENVEQFKVFYGFDDVLAAAPTGGTVPTARRVLTAAGVIAQPVPTGFNPWDYVVSVHVCAIIASPAVAGQGLNINPQATFTPCPQADEATGQFMVEPAADQASTDGRIRRTYRQVFTVRTNAPLSPFLAPT